MSSEGAEVAEPAPKRRRGRPKKAGAGAGVEVKWRESCVQLVQDGLRSLDQGICSKRIAELKAVGLYPCEEKDPVTGAPCLRLFRSQCWLNKHIERANDPRSKDGHRSATGHSARDAFDKEGDV